MYRHHTSNGETEEEVKKDLDETTEEEKDKITEKKGSDGRGGGGKGEGGGKGGGSNGGGSPSARRPRGRGKSIINKIIKFTFVVNHICMGVPSGLNDEITSIYMNAPCIYLSTDRDCGGHYIKITNSEDDKYYRLNLKNYKFNDRISSFRVCHDVYDGVYDHVVFLNIY